MVLNIIKNYLTKNRCYQKAEKRTAIGIQLHTIGCAQGTAQSVADYWNQSAISACVHYIVDCDTPGKVLQCLPEEYYSWADAGYGNKNLITFEICESDYMKYKAGTAEYTITDEAKFKADILRGYNTAVLLCADICERYGWDPTAKLPSGLCLISSHYEGNKAGLSSAHVDPTHVWGKLGLTMDGFRAAVKAAMAGEVAAQPTTEPLYRVRKAWTDVSSQLFAGTLEGAKRACLPGYSVYDESGKCVYTNAPKGFQASDLKGLSEADRIAKVAPLYVESAKITGMLPSVGIAQFCLESGYGSTDLAEFANNLHGMKCNLSGRTWAGSVWDGESKYGKYSPEVENGVTVQRYSEFRKYPCCEDSIADRAAYFTNAMNGNKKRYPGIAQERDHKKAIHIIKTGNYATDPNYEDKLCDLVDRWDLTQYDQGVDMPNAGDILPETDEPWYRVRKTWADTKSQIEADHDLNLAKACADKHPGYYVFDESGKAIYPVKTTNPANPILEQCAKFQAQLSSDLAAGKPWEYHNPSKYLEEQWANAIKKGKRACNCALLARWALKEAGLIPRTTGIFYGAKGGTIKWGGGAKEAVSKTCDIIKVQSKTVKELIASGELLPGDIVTYVDLQHTNIYAGDGKWYDAGHAYCSGSGEGATYKSWYGAGTCDGQKVGYIIRQKSSGDTTVSTTQHIVQAGSYKSKANADKQVAKIKAAGFDAIVKPGDDGQYKIQCGVFKDRNLAEALVKKLEAKGLKAIIK